MNIAVIGAGLAGLTAAGRLVAQGHSVRVFEKSRGAGGRTSTRRTEDGRTFDHGAQYFTVEAPAMAHAVSLWERAGVVAPWRGRIGALAPGARLSAATDCEPRTRYVGVPGMNAVCKLLAQGLDLTPNARVARIEPAEASGAQPADRWSLLDETGASMGGFDAVVISAPAPQTAALCSAAAPEIAAAAAAVRYRASWAVMLTAAQRLESEFDGLFVNGGPLAWAARDNSKPGRPAAESWVLHGSSDWSDTHLEDPAEEAGKHLVDAFCDRLEFDPVTLGGWQAHKWRYALPDPPLVERVLATSCGSLVACGDWCGGPRVEGAYLSGVAAAEHLMTGIGGENQGDSGDGI